MLVDSQTLTFKSEPEYYRDDSVFQTSHQNGVAEVAMTNGDSQQRVHGAVVTEQAANGTLGRLDGAKKEVVIKNGGVTTGVQLKREAVLRKSRMYRYAQVQLQCACRI